MRYLTLALPLFLIACATPQESCINRAGQELRVLNSLIAQTRGNLARGYAIAERDELRTVRKRCVGRNEDGTEFTFRCEETETFTRRVPVAIDLNAERAKLTSLEERQLQMQSNLGNAAAQCRAQFPE